MLPGPWVPAQAVGKVCGSLMESWLCFLLAIPGLSQLGPAVEDSMAEDIEATGLVIVGLCTFTHDTP